MECILRQRYLQLNLPKNQSIFLWGARKTGKSTYLKSNFKSSLYFDFLKHDDYLHYSRTPSALREEILKVDPEKLISPIIIDEVQKIPEVLDEVHWMIENIKNAHFILCGSSIRKLKHIGANLLGGRAWRQLFFPFCYPEMENFNLLKILNHGLIPSHYLSEKYPLRDLQGYLVDYLIPEVQWESRIRQMGVFQRFLEAAAFSNGQMVNYTNIARECGINTRTVQSYFDLLIEMLLGYVIQPFAKSRSRQIITSTPKFYFFDPGITNFLLQKKLQSLKGPEAGHSFEHYLFLELLAFKELNNKNFNINYWRTKSGVEVDFILGNGQIAIEAKISSPIQKRDLSGLIAFSQEHQPQKAIMVCLEPHPRTIKANNCEIQVLPIQHFLKDLWDHKIL